ncbi:ubiquinol-cytochrome c reductase iron-sulfur subunit [Calditrichota bacterium]
MNPEDSDLIPRRKFLDYFLAGSGIAVVGGIGYPLVRYFTPMEQEEALISSVNLGLASDFPKNSGKIFKFGSKPGILIHTKDGQFRAFFAKCTHLDCIVQYNDEAGDIWCACHNGHYNLKGINISGPPPKPLTPLQVNITPESNEIIITRGEEDTA